MAIKESALDEVQAKIWDPRKAIHILHSHQELLDIPLVEIPSSLNPHTKDGVNIFAADMTGMPFSTIKSGPVVWMLDRLSKEGKLAGKTLVEATSGNTGAVMAALAHHYKAAGALFIVSPGTPDKKKNMIRQFGGQVIETPNGIQIARNLGALPDYINPNQYGNDNNWRFFYDVIGPKIWQGMEGDISLFGAGVGSGGTVVGVNRFLQEQDPAISTLGVVVSKGSLVPGVRTLERLSEVQQPWEDAIDAKIFVSAEESYRESHKLRSLGLNFGPSSGFAQVGLINHIQYLKDRGELNSLRKGNGKIRAVYIAPDGPGPYLEEYSKYI